MLYTEHRQSDSTSQLSVNIRDILSGNHYIQASEPRSLVTGGRPLVGVGGLLAFNSCI